MAELRRIADKIAVEAEAFELELSPDEQTAFRADPEGFMRGVLTRDGYAPQNIAFGDLLDNLGETGPTRMRWEHLRGPGWFCHWAAREDAQ